MRAFAGSDARQRLQLRTGPHHDQPLLEPPDRLDDAVDVLVGQQSRDDEQVAVGPVRERRHRLRVARGVDADRGRDHLGGDPVGLGDPLAHDARVAEVAVGAGGRAAVPPQQERPHRGERQPLGRGVRRAAEVLDRLVEPPGRGVAVDEPAAGDREPVRPAAAGRDHHVGVDPQPGRRAGRGTAAPRGGCAAAGRPGSAARSRCARRGTPGRCRRGRRAWCGSSPRGTRGAGRGRRARRRRAA